MAGRYWCSMEDLDFEKW